MPKTKKQLVKKYNHYQEKAFAHQMQQYLMHLPVRVKYLYGNDGFNAFNADASDIREHYVPGEIRGDKIEGINYTDDYPDAAGMKLGVSKVKEWNKKIQDSPKAGEEYIYSSFEKAQHFCTNPENGDLLRAEIDNPPLVPIISTLASGFKIYKNGEISQDSAEILGQELTNRLNLYYEGMTEIVKLQFQRQKDVDNHLGNVTETEFLSNYRQELEKFVENFDKLREEQLKTAGEDGIPKEFHDALQNNLSETTSANPLNARSRTSSAVEGFRAQIQAIKNGWGADELGILSVIGEIKGNTEFEKKYLEALKKKAASANGAEKTELENDIRKRETEIAEFEREFNPLYEECMNAKVKDKRELKVQIAKKVLAFSRKYKNHRCMYDASQTMNNTLSAELVADNVLDPYGMEGLSRAAQMKLIMDDLDEVDGTFQHSSGNFRALRARLEELEKLAKKNPGEMTREEMDAYLEKVDEVKAAAAKYLAGKEEEEQVYNNTHEEEYVAKDITKKRIGFATGLIKKLDCHLEKSVGKFKEDASLHEAEYGMALVARKLRVEETFRKNNYPSKNVNADHKFVQSVYRSLYIESVRTSIINEPDFDWDDLKEALKPETIKEKAENLKILFERANLHDKLLQDINLRISKKNKDFGREFLDTELGELMYALNRDLSEEHSEVRENLMKQFGYEDYEAEPLDPGEVEDGEKFGFGRYLVYKDEDPNGVSELEELEKRLGIVPSEDIADKENLNTEKPYNYDKVFAEGSAPKAIRNYLERETDGKEFGNFAADGKFEISATAAELPEKLKSVMEYYNKIVDLSYTKAANELFGWTPAESKEYLRKYQFNANGLMTDAASHESKKTQFSPLYKPLESAVQASLNGVSVDKTVRETETDNPTERSNAAKGLDYKVLGRNLVRVINVMDIYGPNPVFHPNWEPEVIDRNVFEEKMKKLDYPENLPFSEMEITVLGLAGALGEKAQAVDPQKDFLYQANRWVMDPGIYESGPRAQFYKYADYVSIGRTEAKTALDEYVKGNKEPVAQLVLDGMKAFTSKVTNVLDTVENDAVLYYSYLKGYQDILSRDPELRAKFDELNAKLPKEKQVDLQQVDRIRAYAAYVSRSIDNKGAFNAKDYVKAHILNGMHKANHEFIKVSPDYLQEKKAISDRDPDATSKLLALNEKYLGVSDSLKYFTAKENAGELDRISEELIAGYGMTKEELVKNKALLEAEIKALYFENENRRILDQITDEAIPEEQMRTVIARYAMNEYLADISRKSLDNRGWDSTLNWSGSNTPAIEGKIKFMTKAVKLMADDMNLSGMKGKDLKEFLAAGTQARSFKDMANNAEGAWDVYDSRIKKLKEEFNRNKTAINKLKSFKNNTEDHDFETRLALERQIGKITAMNNYIDGVLNQNKNYIAQEYQTLKGKALKDIRGEKNDLLNRVADQMEGHAYVDILNDMEDVIRNVPKNQEHFSEFKAIYEGLKKFDKELAAAESEFFVTGQYPAGELQKNVIPLAGQIEELSKKLQKIQHPSEIEAAFKSAVLDAKLQIVKDQKRILLSPVISEETLEASDEYSNYVKNRKERRREEHEERLFEMQEGFVHLSPEKVLAPGQSVKEYALNVKNREEAVRNGLTNQYKNAEEPAKKQIMERIVDSACRSLYIQLIIMRLHVPENEEGIVAPEDEPKIRKALSFGFRDKENIQHFTDMMSTEPFAGRFREGLKWYIDNKGSIEHKDVVRTLDYALKNAYDDVMPKFEEDPKKKELKTVKKGNMAKAAVLVTMAEEFGSKILEGVKMMNYPVEEEQIKDLKDPTIKTDFTKKPEGPKLG